MNRAQTTAKDRKHHSCLIPYLSGNATPSYVFAGRVSHCNCHPDDDQHRLTRMDLLLEMQAAKGL